MQQVRLNVQRTWHGHHILSNRSPCTGDQDIGMAPGEATETGCNAQALSTFKTIQNNQVTMKTFTAGELAGAASTQPTWPGQHKLCSTVRSTDCKHRLTCSW